jgi:RNA polymerase sigma-70 factor, ECF subfamily
MRSAPSWPANRPVDRLRRGDWGGGPSKNGISVADVSWLGPRRNKCPRNETIFSSGEKQGKCRAGKPPRNKKTLQGSLLWEGSMQSDCALSGAGTIDTRTAVQATADDVLIRNIAHGDKRAMQVLFARHNVRVFRFITRLIGPTAAAEDLVSEVFIDVWRKAGQFEGRSQVATWLLGIARHKALSHLRNRSVDHLDDDTAQTLQDPADTPETVCEKNDTGALLRRCLTQLSAAHREIIDLVYYHERPMQDVAQILEIPEATVRTRMFYARKHLAELLKSHGVEHAWA